MPDWMWATNMHAPSSEASKTELELAPETQRTGW